MISIQKQPSCKKKGATHTKKCSIKKPRWQPRSGCDGRIMAKVLAKIQANLYSLAVFV